MSGYKIELKFKTIGRFLRENREKKDLTASEVARQLKYSPQFVANWERGMSLPPFKVLRKYCKIIDVSVDSLRELIIANYIKHLDRAIGH